MSISRERVAEIRARIVETQAHYVAKGISDPLCAPSFVEQIALCDLALSVLDAVAQEAEAQRIENTQAPWREWSDRFLTDGNGYAPVSTWKACFAAFLMASGEHAGEGMMIAARAGLMAAHNEHCRLHPPSTGRAKDEQESSLGFVRSYGIVVAE